ncbi:response regulator transcription factor [Candidatus Saccharibacteria bacterium]|jgi:DNA-binding response OmpR family regulator|nr:response regulator transcription factor [Candidatus Saccharibacteria bacterium]
MRILIIEDEVKLAKALQKVLRSEGYAVDIEHDSDGGYAMASTEPYQALIIDRMLPGNDFKDGVDLLRQLRKEGVSTPALFLTALGSIQHKTDGLDSGADDYLVKPFSMDELLARVRALLRRPPEQRSTILTIGELSLDTNIRQAKFKQDLIKLTAKELALLEYLMQSEGRPLSKEQIIAHVWDFDADILPNTVEVYIRYLRNKIDARFNVNYIKTVRGIGYKIEA